ALSINQPVKLLASEGKFDDLLAALALHRLDLVIADEPMPKRVSVKAFNHALGRSAMSFFAAPKLLARVRGAFPASLDGVPMLVPGANASVRQQLEGWFAKHQIAPAVVGEFDDAALLKAFGREGQGVFMAPTVLEDETCAQFGVQVLGRTDELVEEFYAVSVQRRISHPCVLAITDAARGQLFGV
ncbi:MAG: LysR substrate-binding domain-containing protein, partial [Rhodoferax sp.]|nr:LysR substrate-binding domain-containing protein [Rhodoferax sp.]